MISACTTVYNEQDRIMNFLNHASKWADEVVVIDKSSTDGTADVVRQFGAKLIQIPFSRQGFEKSSEIASYCNFDWLWSFTPGEVPTKTLVRTVKSILSNLQVGKIVDVIQVPTQIWTFGRFVPKEVGPWAVSYQSRVLNQRHCNFNDIVHQNVDLTKHSLRIPYSDDRYVFHGTHPDFDSFIRSHTDYARAEASQASNKLARAREALAKAHLHDYDFQGAGKDGLVQLVAWRAYWNLVALACLVEGTSESTKCIYEQRISELLRREWT